MDCSILKTIYGGEIKISTLPIKNLTEKIVTGHVVTDGCSQHLYACLPRYQIPKDAPHRKQYEDDFKAMAAALAPIQRKDGFWNASLHDPTNYGGKETSGTSLFVYGMAWGINNGYLDAKKYQPIITKGWNGMVKEAVHENGFLGYMQGTGKEPKDGQPVTYTSVPNFEDYGLGCFLLAGSEVYKLINAKKN
jgi:unsaturated rhamnogalacturonyl hydrolase